MHLLPSKFDLQEHTPLELHDVEEAPELLQPQAKKIEDTLSSVLIKCYVKSHHCS